MKKPTWSPITALSVLILISAMYNFIINSVISIFAREYIGASIAEVGLIYSAWSVLPIITVPLVGFYCYGKRLLYAPFSASLLLIVSSLGMAFTPSPLALASFRIIQGLGNSFLWGPCMTLIALLAPAERRDSMITWASLAASIGLTLGPAIASVNIAVLDMRSTFFTATAIAILSTVLSFSILQQRGRLIPRILGERDSSLSLKNLPKVIGRDSLRIAFLAHFATASLLGILTAYGTLHAKEGLMVPGEQVSLFLFGYNFMLMLGRIFLMRILENWSKRGVLLSGLTIGVLTSIAMALSDSFTPYFLAFSISGISHSIVFPIGAMIIADNTETRELVFTNAIYMVAWDVGNLLGPAISAPIAQSFGSRSALLIGVIDVASALTLIIYLFRRQRKLVNSEGPVQ